MKILLASDTWSPMVNGVVRSVELLYHQLLALGHDVRVVTLPRMAIPMRKTASCMWQHQRGAGLPGRADQCGGRSAHLPLAGRAGSLGPEVIHTQSEFSTFMLAQRVARRCTARWYIPTILSTRIIQYLSSVSVWAG